MTHPAAEPLPSCHCNGKAKLGWADGLWGALCTVCGRFKAFKPTPITKEEP